MRGRTEDYGIDDEIASRGASGKSATLSSRFPMCQKKLREDRSKAIHGGHRSPKTHVSADEHARRNRPPQFSPVILIATALTAPRVLKARLNHRNRINHGARRATDLQWQRHEQELANAVAR